MDNKRIEIVKDLYEAMPKMDLDTYRRHIHPDFRVVESIDLPFAGVYPGLDGFQELVGKVFELYSEFVPATVAFTAGDDHVMVLVDIKLTGRKSGKSVATQLIEVFKFEGEKLIEIRPFYFDTKLIESIS